jgi:hypothetical protein
VHFCSLICLAVCFIYCFISEDGSVTGLFHAFDAACSSETVNKLADLMGSGKVGKSALI